jgi:cell wall-associated NlpC family hydrolase
MTASSCFGGFLAVVVAGALVGCGGGDGSGPPSSPPPAAPSQKTFAVSGKAIGAQAAVITIAGPETKEATTDAAGNFFFTQLKPGQYTITASQSEALFTPVEQTVEVVNADVSGLVFEARYDYEGLTVEEAARLDDQLPEYTAPEDIILPNGQSLPAYASLRGYDLNSPPGGSPMPKIRLQANSAAAPSTPEERLNDVMMKMLGAARYYSCGRAPDRCATHDHAADTTIPTRNQPAQQGLTYIHGGKSPGTRSKPDDGCPEWTFGVDCSGLVSLLASSAGIQAPHGTDAQKGVKNWKIPDDWGLELAKVDGTMKAGDLVYWSGHGGIATSPSEFISSTGGVKQCLANIKAPRGPVSYTIAAFRQGAPTTILRLAVSEPTASYLAPGPFQGETTLTISRDGILVETCAYATSVDGTLVFKFPGAAASVTFNTGDLTHTLVSGNCVPEIKDKLPPTQMALTQAGDALSGSLGTLTLSATRTATSVTGTFVSQASFDVPTGPLINHFETTMTHSFIALPIVQ